MLSQRQSKIIIVLSVITIFDAITKILGQCPSDMFKCDNGSCIVRNEKCDGQKDCTDGSDETWQHCRQNNCPSFAFRCAYGGCITGKRKCDGRVDCHDGSDETDVLCNEQTITSFPTAATNCRRAEDFQCRKSGECIEGSNKCDGAKDCVDGSDETTELCSAIPCLSFTFTCAYGACVSGKAKCNGVIDCFDGSDETAELCNYKNDLTTTTTRSIIGTVRTTTTTPLPPQTGMVYCNSRDIVKDFSIEATCTTAENSSFKCSDLAQVPVRTVASLKCAYDFHEKDFLLDATCTNDGSWHPLTSCEMDCGKTIQLEYKPTSFNGIQIDNSDAPWHVGIYIDLGYPEYNYTCGGTIISPILILTAAHCVYESEALNRDPTRVRKYKVIAGNLYRDISNAGTERWIKKIIIYSGYKHDVFDQDLAALVLRDHLTFSTKIRPICLRNRYRDPYILNGNLTTWGTGDNTGSNEVLQVVTGLHRFYHDCRKANVSLSDDKFCVEAVEGQRACKGDSGGGYYIQENGKVYLIGILSLAKLNERCSNGFLLMTNLRYFKRWIKDIRKKEELDYKK